MTGLPAWGGKLWAGAPSIAGIERTQDTPPSQLSASDGRFKDYVCMSDADLSCMYFSFVDNCRDYFTLKPVCPSVSRESVKKMIPQMEAEMKKRFEGVPSLSQP